MSNETELIEFVRREAASARKVAVAFVIVGLLVGAFIITYFTFLMTFINAFTPKTLMDWGVDAVSQQIDAQKAEEVILTRGPSLLDQGADSVVAELPKLREMAEARLSSLLDTAANRIELDYSDQMRQVMEQHKDQINEALEAMGDVQKSETAKEDLKQVLLGEFEQFAQEEVDPRKDDVLAALTDIKTKFDHLLETPFDELNEEEQLEYKLVQIAFTLWVRAYGVIGGTGQETQTIL